MIICDRIYKFSVYVVQVSVECSLEYTCINRHPGVTTGISYLHLPLLGRHVNHVLSTPPTIHKSTYNKVIQLIYYDYQKLQPIYLQQNTLTYIFISANVLTMLWTYRRVKKFTQNWTYKNVMRHIYVYLFFLDIQEEWISMLSKQIPLDHHSILYWCTFGGILLYVVFIKGISLIVDTRNK